MFSHHKLVEGVRVLVVVVAVVIVFRSVDKLLLLRC